MFLFILGILIGVAGIVFSFYLTKIKYHKNYAKIIRGAAIGLGVALIFSSCMASVHTGHTGIITTFGRVEENTLDAGLHFIAPWNSVTEIDNRVQKASFDLAAFSKDIQEVNVKYTLNYQIDKNKAQELYRTIGKDYLDTVIRPNISECVKVAVSKYNAEGLVGDRSTLATNIEELLSASLSQYNIQVVSAAVEDLDFTDAFTNAVEAKQVAQQNKLKATTEQEQKVIEEKASAEREIIAANAAAEVAKINAEADLEVTKIQADAAEYAGLKEAAKNKAIAEWLTDTLIQYYYIQQWDGKLPETYVGSEDVSTIVGMK